MKTSRLFWWEWLLIVVLVAGWVVLNAFVSQWLRTSVGLVMLVAVIVCEHRDRECREEDEAILRDKQRQMEKMWASLHESGRAEQAVPARPAVRHAARRNELSYLKFVRPAFTRRAFVEAHYWAVKALVEGEAGARREMNLCRAAWTTAGRLEHYGTPREDYPAEAALLSVAVLWLSCGMNVARAKRRILRLANAGFEDARKYCAVARLQGMRYESSESKAKDSDGQ